MKIIADHFVEHKIFVFDNYLRQNLLLEELGNFFENYEDCQNRQTNVKATMTEWELDIPNLEFFYLKETILDIVGKENLNLYFHESYKIKNIWANIYRKGDFTKRHDHEPTRYSFVYFLKSKLNHSPLVYETIDLKRKKKKVKSINPIEGRLVIFPGFLKHWVPVHIHDEIRITISGNLT